MDKIYLDQERYYKPINDICTKYRIPYVYDWTMSLHTNMNYLIKLMNGMAIEFGIIKDIIEEFIKMFDKDLQETIVKTLEQWQEEGKLEGIINEVLFNQKLDKDIYLNNKGYRVSSEFEGSIQEFIDSVSDHETVLIDKVEGDLNLKIDKPIKILFKEGATFSSSSGYVVDVENKPYQVVKLDKKALKGTRVIEARSNIKEGDLISISGTEERLDGSKNINTETFTVLRNTGTHITIDRDLMVDKDIKSDNIKAYKPIEDVYVGRFKLKGDRKSDNQNGGVRFVGVRNGFIEGINSLYSEKPVINIVESQNVTIGNCVFNEAMNILETGGRGYGVRLENSSNINIGDLTSSHIRHVFNNSSSYNITVNNIIDTYSDAHPIMLAHNSFGGNITFNNIHLEEVNVGGISYSGQGVTKPEDYLGENISIKNLYIKVAKAYSGIDISLPMKNFYIGNFNFKSNETGRQTARFFTYNTDVTIDNLITEASNGVVLNGHSEKGSGRVVINNLVGGQMLEVVTTYKHVDNIMINDCQLKTYDLIRSRSDGSVGYFKIHGIFEAERFSDNSRFETIDIYNKRVLTPSFEIKNNGNVGINEHVKYGSKGIVWLLSNESGSETATNPSWPLGNPIINGDERTLFNIGEKIIKITTTGVEMSGTLRLNKGESATFKAIGGKWWLVR